VAVRREIGEKVAMNLRPLELANAHVRLIPHAPDQREGLRCAGADPAIWRHWPRPAIGAAAFDAQFDWQLEEHAAGRWIIFAVERMGRLVGQTCDVTARISIASSMESLNAGVAAGIVLHEVARRRNS